MERRGKGLGGGGGGQRDLPSPRGLRSSAKDPTVEKEPRQAKPLFAKRNPVTPKSLRQPTIRASANSARKPLDHDDAFSFKKTGLKCDAASREKSISRGVWAVRATTAVYWKSELGGGGRGREATAVDVRSRSGKRAFWFAKRNGTGRSWGVEKKVSVKPRKRKMKKERKERRTWRSRTTCSAGARGRTIRMEGGCGEMYGEGLQTELGVCAGGKVSKTRIEGI